jgi:hypothetical protein
MPIDEQGGEAMKQTHIAGGPLGVARIDRPHTAPTGDARPRAGKAVAAVSLAGRLLLGALIVETFAVASFGVAVGTTVAVLGAVILAVGLRVASDAARKE